MKTYIRIPVEGDPSLVTIQETDDELEILQGIVGGLIEPVPVDENHDLYVNEEGLLENLPVNFNAMFVAAHQFLVGDAVMVGPVDDEGNTGSVSQAWIERLVPDGTDDSMGAGSPDPD